MIKWNVMAVVLLLLAACSAHEQHTGAQKTTPENSKHSAAWAIPADTTLRLQFFNSFPDTIDGCSEVFTYDTINIDDRRYIFVSNFDLGILRINGKHIYLHKDTAESRFIEHKSDISVYRGSGYRVIFKLKITGEVDEVFYSSGTMEVISDKIKKKFRVHGESGC